MSKTNNTDLPKLILSKILHDDHFCRSILPFVKARYFDGNDRILYELIRDFVNEHNTRPTKTALDIELQQSSSVSEKNAPECFATCGKIFNEDFCKVDADWLSKTTEKWCKERAMFLAVIESFNIIQGEDAETQTGLIPDMMKDALSVSFDNRIGHDYINDAFHRYDYYQKTEVKVPFDLQMLNEITNGGVSRKTLNLLIGGVNVGKTLCMCHMAAAALAQGKNVLYITMEMAEEEIAKRIDANLLDIPIGQLDLTSRDDFGDRVNKLKKISSGNLIIKEFPTGSAHAGHFRALLNDIKLKKGYTPDVIFVDYLNICASSRYKGSAGDSYGLVKSISEEIRGLAVEFNTIFWSATQLNRSGFCLDVNTEIQTDNGIIKINDVKLGDRIKSNTGYNTVTHVFDKVKKQAYKITLESGKTIICSDEHKFPTADGREISISEGLKVEDKLIVN